MSIGGRRERVRICPVQANQAAAAGVGQGWAQNEAINRSGLDRDEGCVARYRRLRGAANWPVCGEVCGKHVLSGREPLPFGGKFDSSARGKKARHRCVASTMTNAGVFFVSTAGNR